MSTFVTEKNTNQIHDEMQPFAWQVSTADVCSVKGKKSKKVKSIKAKIKKLEINKYNGCRFLCEIA